MTRNSKRRSWLQKQQADEMQKRGLALRTSSATNITEPVDPRMASKRRKRDQKEAKTQKRLFHMVYMQEERLKVRADEQAKVIDSPGKFGIAIEGWLQVIRSLKSELAEARNEKRKLECGVEDSKQEVNGWRDEAREQKVEAGQLKRRVRRFEQLF